MQAKNIHKLLNTNYKHMLKTPRNHCEHMPKMRTKKGRPKHQLERPDKPPRGNHLDLRAVLMMPATILSTAAMAAAICVSVESDDAAAAVELPAIVKLMRDDNTFDQFTLSFRPIRMRNRITSRSILM